MSVLLLRWRINQELLGILQYLLSYLYLDGNVSLDQSFPSELSKSPNCFKADARRLVADPDTDMRIENLAQFIINLGFRSSKHGKQLNQINPCEYVIAVRDRLLSAAGDYQVQGTSQLVHTGIFLKIAKSDTRRMACSYRLVRRQTTNDACKTGPSAEVAAAAPSVQLAEEEQDAAWSLCRSSLSPFFA